MLQVYKDSGNGRKQDKISGRQFLFQEALTEEKDRCQNCSQYQCTDICGCTLQAHPDACCDDDTHHARLQATEHRLGILVF